MSDIPLDEVIHFDCITHNATTGAVTDADSTPTFAVYEESTDTDIGVGGNLTKRTALTGNYRGSFTASAANGFEVGKFYNVIASGTVNSVAGKAVVMRFRCCAAESLAGYGKADVHALKGDAQSATDLKDFADAGYDPSTNKVQGVVLVDTTTTNTDMRGTDNAALAATALNTATWTGTLATNIGTTNTTVATNLDATVSSRLAAVSYTAPANSDIAAILVDTNELQADWVNGGRLDLILDARATQTSVDAIQSDTNDIQTRLPAALEGGRMAAELDSAGRLAIWNTLTTQSFTADSFGELIIISDGTNGREVKVTGSGHVAADVHGVQPDGLSGSTEIIAILADTNNILDGVAWILADATGAIAAPQSATATAILTTFGATYTVQYAGLTSTGVRAAPTLSKV